jgi:hypothetical protein
MEGNMICLRGMSGSLLQPRDVIQLEISIAWVAVWISGCTVDPAPVPIVSRDYRMRAEQYAALVPIARDCWQEVSVQINEWFCGAVLTACSQTGLARSALW